MCRVHLSPLLGCVSLVLISQWPSLQSGPNKGFLSGLIKGPCIPWTQTAEKGGTTTLSLLRTLLSARLGAGYHGVDLGIVPLLSCSGGLVV